MPSAINRAKAEERANKVRQMMMRRPACASLRWDRIRDDLSDIMEEVGDGQWTDGQYAQLAEALDWDDELLYEFRIAFSDLSAECNQMYSDMEDLRERDQELFYGVEDPEYDDPPALFDLFFPAIDLSGDVWGYDVTEHDYYGFSSAYEEDAAREAARRRLSRLTKEQLLKLAGLCMEIARQYLSIMARYDTLTSVMRILRGEEQARMKAVVRLEELYEAAEAETHGFKPYMLTGKTMTAFEAALGELPDRIWIE